MRAENGKKGNSLAVYRTNELLHRCYGQRLDDQQVSQILAKPAGNFAEWFQGLADEAVVGLKDECVHYIRCWGSGGGSFSVQESIENALSEIESDAPKQLAAVILYALGLTGETLLESTVLVMDIINDSLLELGSG